MVYVVPCLAMVPILKHERVSHNNWIAGIFKADRGLTV